LINDDDLTADLQVQLKGVSQLVIDFFVFWIPRVWLSFHGILQAPQNSAPLEQPIPGVISQWKFSITWPIQRPLMQLMLLMPLIKGEGRYSKRR